MQRTARNICPICDAGDPTSVITSCDCETIPAQRAATIRNRHWSNADFVVTDQSPAYDDSGALNQRGYCRNCLGDMQRFGKAGQHGPLHHYSSHIRARQLGLWSGKDSRPQLI